MNLNHWADGAWAQDSWVAASWGTEEAPSESAVRIVVGDGGLSWADEVEARFRRRELQRELAKARREETKLVKQEAKILRKVGAEKRQDHPIEGILTKYLTVSFKIEEKRVEIKKLEIEFRDISHYLDDDEDIEAILFS
jgi:hypothetical protein